MEVVLETQNNNQNVSNEILEKYKENISMYAASLKCGQYLEIPAEVGQNSTKYRSTWSIK